MKQRSHSSDRAVHAAVVHHQPDEYFATSTIFARSNTSNTPHLGRCQKDTLLPLLHHAAAPPPPRPLQPHASAQCACMSDLPRSPARWSAAADRRLPLTLLPWCALSSVSRGTPLLLMPPPHAIAKRAHYTPPPRRAHAMCTPVSPRDLRSPMQWSAAAGRRLSLTPLPWCALWSVWLTGRGSCW